MMAQYAPHTWHDLPATDTPISAARLAEMEAGIAAGVNYDPTGTGLLSNTQADAVTELDADRAVDTATAVTQARAGMIQSTDQPLLVGHGNYVVNAEQTLDRAGGLSGNSNATTGIVFLSFLSAQQSRTVTTLTVVTAGTAGSPAPSIGKLGLFSVDPTTGDLTLLAASTNDTALLTAASTVYTKTIAATAITKGSRYAVGVLQVGSTTPPKLYGQVTVGAINSRPPIIAAQFAAADMPSSIPAGSLAATTGMSYAEIA